MSNTCRAPLKSKQGEQGNQEKTRQLPTGQAAGRLRPNQLRPNQLKHHATCSWVFFWNHWQPLRCVCVTLPRPGMPAHASSETDPRYWGKGREDSGLLSLVCSRFVEPLVHPGIGDFRSGCSNTACRVHHRALALLSLEPDSRLSFELHHGPQPPLEPPSFFLLLDGRVVAAPVDFHGIDARALGPTTIRKGPVVGVGLWNAASQLDVETWYIARVLHRARWMCLSR